MLDMAKIDEQLKRRKNLEKLIRDSYLAIRDRFSWIDKARHEIEKIDTDLLNRIEKARDAILGDDVEHVRPQAAHAQANFSNIVVMSAEKNKRVPSLQAPITHAVARYTRPVTVAEILSVLESTGVKVKGKRPKNTLSAHVSYLIEKGVLVRVGEGVTLKQASIPGTNESAAKH
jgi:hypothetical protein